MENQIIPLPPEGFEFSENPVAPKALPPAEPQDQQEDIPPPPEGFDLTENPSASGVKTAAGIAAEVGLPLAGGAIGAFLAGVPTLGAGAPAGAVAGAAIGTSIGAAIGGTAGNYVKQLLEISSGERKEVSGGQLLTSGVVSAIPASLGAKTIAQSTGLLKPIMFRGVQGGVTAAVSEVAEKAIDEGRMPTWTELAERTATGAALGGALGGVEKRYATAGKLITNPIAAQAVQGATALGVTAYAWNDAVQKGDENPIAKSLLYGAAAYGATHIPSAIMQMEKQAALRKIVGPEKILGKEAVELLQSTENKLNAEKDFATQIANDLAEGLKKAGATNPSDLANAFSVLDGRASVNILPEEVRPFVTTFINERANNTDRLIELFPHLADDLRQAIADNRSSYLRTAYAAHDPRAVKGVDYATDAASARFKSELVSDFMAEDRSLSTAEAAAKADSLMANMINDVGFMFSAGFGGKKGTSPASGLLKKGDLSDAAKEYLGVIKDPGSAIRSTLNTQARLIIQEQRDKDLYEVMRNAGIISTQSLPGYTKVMAEDAPVLHRSFAGKFAPKEFVEAYKEMVNPNLFGDGVIAKNYMALSGFAKAMKTVGNLPEAIMPQVVGNIAMAASSFKANPLAIKEALYTAAKAHGMGASGLTAEGKVQFAKELRELRSLGVISGGVESNELTSLISQAASGRGLFAGKGSSFLDKMSKTYGFPDTVLRYAIYKQNVDEIRKFGVGYFGNENNLKKLAAEVTNSQFPTYEKIPRRLRQLSAAGIANVFGGFEFEVMRNTANQLKYASKLIADGRVSGNNEMMKAGFKRIIGLTSVASATAGMAVYGSRLMGISEQDQKDLQMVTPGFDANKANIYNLHGDGKFSYTPVNYLMPYANMTATIAEALKGGNPLPYAKSTILGDDFGPMLTSGIEGLTNTYYGTKVAITEPRNNIKLLERFAIRAFMPQVVTGTISRMEKAARGETNKLGMSPTFGDVGLRFAGYRQNTLDILGSAAVRIRDYSDPIAGELSGYHRILNQAVQRGDTALANIDEDTIYNQRNFNYRKGQEELSKVYQALNRLSERTGDFGDKEIIEAFKKAGVPNALIAGAALNYVVDMPRGLSESNTRVAERIDIAVKDGASLSQAISTEAAGDPIKMKALQSAYKSLKMNEARGGDAVTKLFSGMSVEDGDRAANIVKAMRANPELADSLMRKLMTTKVITPAVISQMNRINSEMQ
jgi:hypothetical protein